MPHLPLWEETARRERLPALDRDFDVDVAVIGGGITGLLTALLLARAGYAVAVLEADRVGSGATGASTGHLTVQPDVGFHTLLPSVGEEACRTLLRAGTDALDLLEDFCRDHRVPGFARVDAWAFAERPADLERLRAEAAALRRLGAVVEETDAAPLPFPNLGGYRLAGQATLHPVATCLALAEAVRDAGGHVFEDSRVEDWTTGSPVRVRCNGCEVRAAFLVLATHTPVGRSPSVHGRLQPVTSHVLAYALAAPLPPGLYRDGEDPCHGLRALDPTCPELVLVGGADRPTGQRRDHRASFAELDRWARARLPVVEEIGRWSHTRFESVDGVACIGPQPRAPRVPVATGFAGQGLALGAAAARVLADTLQGEPHPYRDVFDPGRLTLLSALRLTVRQGVETMVHRVGHRLRPPEREAIGEVAPGEGALVREDGRLVAVWRDETGRAVVLDPRCRHAGCCVQWNDAERTWDCPCHGGRYHADGRVLSGPPLRPLDVLRVEEPAPEPDAVREAPATAPT